MYELFDYKSQDKWKIFSKTLPERQISIFLDYNFYYSFKNHKDQIFCFSFKDRDKIAMYPFYMNTNNKIYGCPGYNGIFANDYSNEFKIKFFENFNMFLSDFKIIEEFSKCNPILKNHLFFNQSKKIKKNININLKKNLNLIVSEGFESSAKRNLNSSLKHDLDFQIYGNENITIDIIRDFYDIYLHTMKRTAAKKENIYPFEIFKNLRENCRSNILFCFAAKNNKKLSTELILFDNLSSYFFLGGTLEEYFKFRPNIFLKYKIIETLKKKNIENYCLGGGVEAEDSLYKYKRKFAKNGEIFFYIYENFY